MRLPWSKPRSSSARRTAAKSPRRRPTPRPRRDRPPTREFVDRLEQRHYDVIGLALFAAAVYVALVLYFGWDGGVVGGWIADALSNLAGRVAYIAPIALAAWGAALIARQKLDTPSALNAGGILLIAALLLGFAAQTAGLGPDHPHRHDYFEHRFMVAHGGVLGESLYWASSTLFQRVGAHILALLMIISGALLVTGTTVAGILGSTSRAMRRAGTHSREMARTARSAPTAATDVWGDARDEEIAITRQVETETFETEALAAEEEPETVVVDGRHGGPRQEPDGFTYTEPGEDDRAPNPDAGERDGSSEGESKVTPMGNKRHAHGITASDEIDYRPPPAKALEKGKADPGPDTRDREATASALLESLRHFGVEARLLGTVSGPHVSRYELQLAPGTKVSKVAQLKDDLAYALASTDIRILAPIPGKKAVGNRSHPTR